MTLYVRMLGWLHAAPVPDKPSKGFQPETRLAAYKRDGTQPPLPPCPSHELVDLLFEAGPYSMTGMGSVPLPWSEIDAWIRVTGRSLSFFVVQLIHSLSSAYLSELKQAEKMDHPRPFIDRVTIEQSRDRVSTQIQSALKSRAPPRRK